MAYKIKNKGVSSKSQKHFDKIFREFEKIKKEGFDEDTSWAIASERDSKRRFALAEKDYKKGYSIEQISKRRGFVPEYLTKRLVFKEKD